MVLHGVVSEPKQVELKVSYKGTRLVSFTVSSPQINVGNSAKFNFTLTKMEIQAGETFSLQFRKVFCIEKIYSSPIAVQAGYISTNNQVFLSDTIQVQGYNLTIGQSEPSVIPQSSNPANSSVIIKPINSNKKPAYSNQVKPIPIATQRVNESKQHKICYAMVICLSFFITFI